LHLSLFAFNDQPLTPLQMRVVDFLLDHKSEERITLLDVLKQEPLATNDDLFLAMQVFGKLYYHSGIDKPPVVINVGPVSSLNTSNNVILEESYLSTQPADDRARLLLQGLRTKAGLSRLQLGETIGVSADTIQNWETGRHDISPYKLQAIATALSLEPHHKDQLFKLALPEMDGAAFDNQPPGNKSVGALLAAYRKRAGYTQDELTSLLHVSDKTVSSWEIEKFVIEDSKLPSKLGELKTRLHLSDDEFQRLSYLVLPMLDPQELAKKPEGDVGRLLLATYRKRAGFSQPALEEKMGLGHNKIVRLESGEDHLRSFDLGAFIAPLSLSNAEAATFLLAAKPELIKHVIKVNADYPKQVKIWLERQIEDIREKAGNGQVFPAGVTPVHLPALDTQWLKLQQKEMRPGLLLAAFRVRKGLKQVFVRSLAPEEDAMTQAAVSDYERGVVPINPAKIAFFKKHYEFSNEEERQLMLLVLPALDPKWLNKQPKIDHSHYLLKAFRERSGLNQQQLGGLVGVPKGTITRWEAHTSPVPLDKIEDLKIALNLQEKYDEPQMLGDAIARSDRLLFAKRESEDNRRVKPPMTSGSTLAERIQPSNTGRLSSAHKNPPQSRTR
jgi:transcriptional regulator with XRE-family HTH domain